MPLMPPAQSARPRSRTQLPLTMWSKNTESILSDGRESHEEQLKEEGEELEDGEGCS